MDKIKFIFVDDDSDIHAIVDKKMGEKFEIIHSDGNENVLDLVEKHKCHIIVTDLNMPNKSGFDVLKEVKSIDPAATLIAVTGDAKYAELLSSIQEGFDDYFKKPIKFDELSEVISFHRKKINRWISR